MNSIFIRVLNEKYSNQFIMKANEDVTFLKFPAKNTDFGDVDIYEDAPGKYVIELGKFTHGHFDVYDVGRPSGKPQECAPK